MDTDIKEISRNIREDIIQLTYNRGRKGAHIAPSLSMVEIIAVLFQKVIDWNKDLFILSKGHGGLAYYCGLKAAGIISKEQLYTFDADGGDFPGQPSKKLDSGIIFSSGSLGMGLSYGVGRAVAMKNRNQHGKVYVLMGDGETNEGSVWESAMLASQLSLDNLVVIIDWNGMQSDGKTDKILSLDMEAIWKALHWNVVACNGHDEDQLESVFRVFSENMPTMILARTIKGKGVSFMENQQSWHHGFLTEEQYRQAMEEVAYGI